MASKTNRRLKAAASALLLLTVLLGLPAFLSLVIGNPLPESVPQWGNISTSITQRNISGDVVVNTLGVLLWMVWAQFAWAAVWEIFVAGPRIAKGIRTRSAPLVAGPLAAATAKLVSAILAVGVAASASNVSAALPTRSVVAPAPAASPAASALMNESASASAELHRAWSVGPGDSLWSISGSDQSIASQILDLNESVSSPLDVVPGIELLVPASVEIPSDRQPAEQEQDSNSAAVRPYPPSGVVQVRSGDSLWEISEERLAAADIPANDSNVAQYVDSVVDNNASVQDNPDLIHPGDMLVMPLTIDGSSVGDVEIDGPDVQGDDPPIDSVHIQSPPIKVGGQHVHDPEENAEILELPARPSGAPRQLEPSSGVFDTISRSRIDLGLGGGGLLLGAGALSLLRRRRQYRLAHRRPGTIPTDPDSGLSTIERMLQSEADLQTAQWVAKALRSLSQRQIWEQEEVPQPLVAELTDESLVVTLAAQDQHGAPVPWQSPDDGTTWRLARTCSIDEIPDVVGQSALPTFVTLASNFFVNLEGMGVLEISGLDKDGLLGVARSLSHEMAVGSGSCLVDIRTSIPIPGSAAYNLLTPQSAEQLVTELVPWLSDFSQHLETTNHNSTYAYRLANREEPVAPVVLLIDENDRAMLAPLFALTGQGLPIAIVVLDGQSDRGTRLDSSGSHPGGIVENQKPSFSLRFSSETEADLEPYATALTVQQISESTAHDLGLLLAQGSAPEDEPLLATVELSAPVIDLRAGRRAPLDRTASVRTQNPPSGSSAASSENRADNLTVAPGSSTESELDSGDDEGIGPGQGAASEPLRALVLGDIAVSGFGVPLTPQQLSLVTFLACVGKASRPMITEALWDGQEISRSRFANLLAETRAVIGRHLLPEARSGIYELRDVDSDLAVFEEAVAQANRQDSALAVKSLAGALALVRGVPLSTPGGRYWSWVGDHSHLGARVESMVADAASRMAGMCRSLGDLDQARWACEQGLLASPLDQTLVTILTEVYVELGKPGLARRVVEDWETKINRLDCGEPSLEPRKRLAG